MQRVNLCALRDHDTVYGDAILCAEIENTNLFWV